MAPYDSASVTEPKATIVLLTDAKAAYLPFEPEFDASKEPYFFFIFYSIPY